MATHDNKETASSVLDVHKHENKLVRSIMILHIAFFVIQSTLFFFFFEEKGCSIKVLKRCSGNY